MDRVSSLRQLRPANNHTSYVRRGPLYTVDPALARSACSIMLQQLISPAGFHRVQLVAGAPSRLCRPLPSALLLLLGDEPEVRVRPEPCHHADRQGVFGLPLACFQP